MCKASFIPLPALTGFPHALEQMKNRCVSYEGHHGFNTRLAFMPGGFLNFLMFSGTGMVVAIAVWRLKERPRNTNNCILSLLFICIAVRQSCHDPMVPVILGENPTPAFMHAPFIYSWFSSFLHE
jgi:hypothetical protein